MGFNNEGNYGLFITRPLLRRNDSSRTFKVPSNLWNHERTINRPWGNLPLVERRSHIGMKRAIPEVIQNGSRGEVIMGTSLNIAMCSTWDYAEILEDYTRRYQGKDRQSPMTRVSTPPSQGPQ